MEVLISLLVGGGREGKQVGASNFSTCLLTALHCTEIRLPIQPAYSQTKIKFDKIESK